MSYICHKTLLLSSIFNKCRREDEKIFMEGESIEILKIIGLINNIEKYQNYKIMTEKNQNQKFKLIKLGEINYLIEEINQGINLLN